VAQGAGRWVEVTPSPFVGESEGLNRAAWRPEPATRGRKASGTTCTGSGT